MKNIALSFFVFLNILFAIYDCGSTTLSSPSSIIVIIPPHSNNIEISRRLVNAGVLTNPWSFLLGTYLDRKKTFDPGKYIFKPNMPIIDVISVLKAPRTYKVTIPEGLTVAEIARLLNEQSFLTGGIFQLPAEGMLLPETYVVRYGDKREAVVKRLETAMKTTLKTLWEISIQSKARTEEYGIKTELELLTLASIVEKETGIALERAHIAGVFLNRLAKKMRLQSDPTVSYAITGGKQPLGRLLTRNDLTIPSLINTYVNTGLPPQPIACPGKAALLATLAPETTNNLYFVADGTGGHRFSETLDGHNTNVSYWRKVRRNVKG
ncbi:MAG: endolytic transglycosylase MltG [Pseudomonadota bacterium]